MTAERDFGHAMRLLRASAGISQVTLAQRLAEHGFHGDGVTVLRMEKGPRMIRLDEAVAIAAVFGHTVDDMMRLVRPDPDPVSGDPPPNLLRMVGDRLRLLADEIDGGAR